MPFVRVSVLKKNYGIPYMGSKAQICDELMEILPKSENFYDLFGGGFSVTHAAVVHKKAKHYFFNEITGGPVELVKKAINGEFSYKNFKPHFISREEFFEKKDSCPYTRIVWSFGNNQKDYLFSKELEGKKKSLHNAVVFDTFDETAKDLLKLDKWPDGLKHIKNKRLFCRQRLVQMGHDGLKQLQQLERIEQLERLEQLQKLEGLDHTISFSALDYRDVEIKPNSIVYCDPPYINTQKYTVSFSHKDFYEWARKSTHPIFISEYTMPNDFRKIAGLGVKSTLSAIGATSARENVYVNKAAADRYLNLKQKR